MLPCRPLTLLLAAVCVACGPGAPKPPPDRQGPGQGDEELQPVVLQACQLADPPPIPAGTVLVLTADLANTSGGLDRFDSSTPSDVAHNLVVTSGDAVLKRLGGEAAILDRAGDNVSRIDANLNVAQQVALGGCNPHDIEPLDPCYAVVSCYDDNRLRVVEWQAQEVFVGPDLSAFADGDGIAEADHFTRAGNVLYLSLQRLDRNDTYAPSHDGYLVPFSLDLELIDAAPTTSALDAYILPARNPFTEMYTTATGVLTGCAGDFYAPTPATAITELSLQTKALDVRNDQSSLGGKIVGLAAGGGEVFALVMQVNFTSGEATSMSVVEVTGTPSTVHSATGFSLAGLARAPDGALYVGDRSGGTDTGVWRLRPSVLGPIDTALPPMDVVAF